MKRNPLMWLCALVAAGVFAPAQAQPVVPAPAFTGKQLTTLPSTNWITNGGRNAMLATAQIYLMRV